MSKIDEIRSEMVAAMKAGDKERKAALSFLLSSLKNKAIDKRADLTEEEEGQVILKEIKQTKETLEMTPADRTDIIEECEKRIAVLEQYAPKMMEEAEKRDHRKLGKQLDLFSFHEEGPGFPFFHPKGMILRNNLLKFWHELHPAPGKAGCQAPARPSDRPHP